MKKKCFLNLITLRKAKQKKDSSLRIEHFYNFQKINLFSLQIMKNYFYLNNSTFKKSDN